MKLIANTIINTIIFALSFFIPKNKKLAVVGGWRGKRFADNSKYFFIEYYNLYRSQYDLWWVTRDKRIYDTIKSQGRNVVMCNTLKSFWIHIRAKYHIIDQAESDIMGWTSFTAVRINLWHGIPLKKIWRSQSSKSRAFLSKILGDCIYDNMIGLMSKGGWKDFRLLIPSKNVAHNNFRKCISVRQMNLAVFSPYPRVSFLINGQSVENSENEALLIRSIENLRCNGNKIAIYMPTFRDSQKYKVMGALNETEIEQFNDTLRENKITLFVKPHPADKSYRNIVFSNIIMVLPDVDIYPILKYSDCLITDYSSIFFDYLVLNKPILFYAFDYDYYKKNDRGIVVDFTDYDVGTVSFTLNELSINIIEELNRDSFLEKREGLTQKIFDSSFPNLHERIIKNEV